MKDPLRSYSVTVTMTPRQAVEAMEALDYAGRATGKARLYAASARIEGGMIDAGWRWDAAQHAWVRGREAAS